MATQAFDTRTERMVVLVSASEKRCIAEKARAASMTLSDYVRTAAERYDEPTEAELSLLKELLTDLERANERSRIAFEEMEAQRERSRRFDEQVYKDKVRAELEARTDIDWDRIADFLGLTAKTEGRL